MEQALRCAAEVVFIALGLWVTLVRGGAARHPAKLGAPRAGTLVLFPVAWLTIHFVDGLRLTSAPRDLQG